MTARQTIAAFMTRDPVTLTPDTEVNKAAALLLRHRISGAPVVDSAGRLAGMFTAKDCFKVVLHASYHQEVGGPVADYMASPVETLDAHLDIITAAERFLATPYRRFPVVDEGRLVGIITRLDLLSAFQTER